MGHLCRLRGEHQLKIIQQDILAVTHGTIGHQVNCQGVMGAGLAYRMRSKYSGLYHSYRSYHAKAAEAGDISQLLGKVQPFKVNENLTILNLFGQLWHGTDRRHTDYKALATIAKKMRGRDITPYLPYKMGCGLGGGDWDIVQDIFSGVDGWWCRLLLSSGLRRW